MVYGTGRVCDVQWAAASVAASFRDDAARAAFARRVLVALARHAPPMAWPDTRYTDLPAALSADALAFVLDDVAWRAVLFRVSFLELLRSCA